MTFYEVYYGQNKLMNYNGLKWKKKMQLREKESNEIFKVKNLCIYASAVLWLKNIPRCTLHQSKPCCWAKMETLQTKQNFVAEQKV